MRWRSAFAAGACALALVVVGSAQERKKPQQGNLKVGDPAPLFELADANGKNSVKLADLKGKPVVLIFGSCT